MLLPGRRWSTSGLRRPEQRSVESRGSGGLGNRLRQQRRPRGLHEHFQLPALDQPVREVTISGHSRLVHFFLQILLFVRFLTLQDY